MTPVDFPWRPLGEHLVERGFIVPRELEAALAEQERTGRKLGAILLSRGAITGAQLTRVLVEQAGFRLEPAGAEPVTTPAAPSESYESEPWRPLGRVLVDRGVLTGAELEVALQAQRESGRRLGEILVERGYVTAQTLVSAVIAQHGLEEETPTAAVVATPASGEETYQVEDHSPEDEEEARVVFRSEAFLDAVDFAFEYLEAESPERLRIFRVLGRKREEVWTYVAETAAENEERPRDLLDVYGYDVINWRGPGAA